MTSAFQYTLARKINSVSFSLLLSIYSWKNWIKSYIIGICKKLAQFTYYLMSISDRGGQGCQITSLALAVHHKTFSIKGVTKELAISFGKKMSGKTLLLVATLVLLVSTLPCFEASPHWNPGSFFWANGNSRQWDRAEKRQLPDEIEDPIIRPAISLANFGMKKNNWQ